MKLKSFIALVIFGIVFLVVGSIKVEDYNSLKDMESVYVDNMSSKNIRATEITNNKEVVDAIYDFVIKNNDYNYSLYFNDSVYAEYTHLSKASRFPIIEGSYFSDDNISEVLIGMSVSKINNLGSIKPNQKISHINVEAVVSGITGTSTFMSDANTGYIYDIDTLKNNPETFSSLISIVVSNPMNKYEFENITNELYSILESKGVEVNAGNTVYGGSNTSLYDYIKQIVLEISGILFLLVLVLLMSTANVVKEQKNLHSIYKLLGYTNERIVQLEAKNKLIFVFVTTITTVIIAYLLNSFVNNQYVSVNNNVLIYYLVVNVVTYLLLMGLTVFNIYNRRIRWDL